MNFSPFSTISNATAAIRTRAISTTELVETTLERISILDPKLRAFANLDAEGARAQARKADSAITRNAALGSLHGVPVTIKGNIDVAGLRCPAGSLLRKDYVAQHDAPLVARLRAAGAIILGNTNTPEFLMAYESDNLLIGKTSNPWDLSRSAGGSSGGEAAAIASGCSFGGVGSDGGGSIRVPAHFSGICGLKPTSGRVPSTGHFPPGAGLLSWLGVVGPMARTIADVRALFQVLAGPDPGDALSSPVPLSNIDGSTQLNDLRIGLLESSALPKASPETEAAVQKAAGLLADQGFSVEPFQLSGLDRALDIWWFFFGPVVAHLFGPTVEGHEEQLSPILREYLHYTTPEKPITLDALFSACAARDNTRAEILRQLQDVPILLSPVSSGPAFRHGEGTYRPNSPHCYGTSMRHSQWLNLVGCPGASVPVGVSLEGLPIGVQVIGRPHEEELVLAVAERIEQARGPWQAPPLKFPS
jgi:Asp-tRNA(Asn)/Glu-tRNA(Gln) amidotransferase A subunit family amidase